MNYQYLEVGKPYDPEKKNYREEVKFDFGQSGATLIIAFNSPSVKEIDHIKNSDIEVGVYPKDELLFMLFKFGTLNWIDAPYSVHLSEPFTLEEIPEEMGYSLFIVLIDAATGIVKALRTIGLSTKFSRQLQKLILNQKMLPFDKNEYLNKIALINNNYSTKDLTKRTLFVYKHKGDAPEI